MRASAGTQPSLTLFTNKLRVYRHSACQVDIKLALRWSDPGYSLGAIRVVPKQRPPTMGTIATMAGQQPSKEVYDQRWHDAWQIGVAPGQKWDMGRPAPALVEFLDTNFLHLQGKTAYVPGCGRGYDVVELARRGANVTGLDLAPESTLEAKKHLQQQAPGSLPGSAHFVSGDFFVFRTEQPWVEVGYDYTFMCALHPTMRADWARTWAKLVRPGGCLVTLEFPIRPDDKTGPPWPVSHQVYTELLAPHGFRNVYLKEVDPTTAAAKVPGAQILSVWQKTNVIPPSPQS